MLNFFSQENLRTDGKRRIILESLEYAFRKNDPSDLVFNYLSDHRVSSQGRVYVIGFGKAALEMYSGALRYFDSSIHYGGIIIPADTEIKMIPPGVEILRGEHPLPGTQTLESSRRLVGNVGELEKDDLVLVLISGGGSSLFEILDERISLDEYRRTIECLMENGINIGELNSIRYIYSKVKGGRLVKFLRPARIIGLDISDVPGDSIETIASGPLSSPPPSSLIDGTVRKFSTKCNIKILKNEETGGFDEGVENHIILRNQDFVDQIENFLSSRGYRVINIGSGITGSVEEISGKLYNRLISEKDRGGPAFLVGGGESTAIVRGNGKGGRNLELCLRFLLRANESDNFVFSSIGSDGIDGNSGAMGGIVDALTLRKLTKKTILEYLEISESLSPLLMTGDAIITGRTGNNVSDLFIGYIEK